MKIAVLGAAIATVASAAVSPILKSIKDEFVWQTKFVEFMEKYDKQYDTLETFKRFTQYKENMQMIAAHDPEHHGWTMAENEFADLSWDEFSDIFKGYNHQKRPYLRALNAHKPLLGASVATAIDWVEKGAVTPVKNQGQCGSCWAFSTTGAIEGARFLKEGKLVSLSEQHLVDCSSAYGNHGCQGGLMDNAFEFVKAEGLASEADYPYTGKSGKCNKSVKLEIKPGDLDGYKDVISGSEKDLMSALNVGPVSVAIEADQVGFQFYSGGVFSGRCGKKLDHGVLVVGYGSDNGKDYWLVKNSWGATWGDKGFIKFIRGKDECGVSDAASYPEF